MDTYMDSLVIAGKSFRSRLIVGTGKYKDGPKPPQLSRPLAPRL